MLYSKMLLVMGELFKDKCLVKKSEEIKNKVIEQSFNGEFFIDNAVRNEEGVLCPTSNCSETCQYYAYFFNIADVNDAKYDTLTNTVIHVFGPTRKESGEMPEIAFSNAFIGNYLRIIILLRLKQFDKVISDIKGYFLKMASFTGTLWEYDDIETIKKYGSMNHGFASFAGVALVYALAGIRKIDYIKKFVYVDKSYLSNTNYSLQVGTDDGAICVTERDGEKVVKLPDGWNAIT